MNRRLSFLGVATYVGVLLWAAILNSYSVVTLVTSIILCAFFLSAALVATFCNLPLLWVAIAGGNTVLFFCSNVGEQLNNPQYLFGMVVSILIATSSIVFFILQKEKMPKFHLPTIALFVAVTLLGGSLWGGNVMAVRNSKEVQEEIWAVPSFIDTDKAEHEGTLKELTYQTRAYGTDRRQVEKKLWVYLPYGYDESKQYEILYLMHGTGDYEDYWLVKNPQNKTMLDNMIDKGYIKPVIVVTPTWYVENDFEDDLDKLTYSFAEELSTDVIPFVEKQFSTYANRTVTVSSLVASREHRAFAGLSRGSATVFHSGINQNLDYFSKFACFSACMTTEEEFEDGLYKDIYSIDYLYNTTGTFDFMAREHWNSVQKLYENGSKISEKNSKFTVFPMRYHSMGSWHVALYNTLQLFYSGIK